eukprot:Lithocolla_globosa_v1_NODE_305_length_4584_cov_10.581365.p2 type:complete len:287 gc:universal NODE_305_length_4584_cov_10.581365:953-93(-)
MIRQNGKTKDCDCPQHAGLHCKHNTPEYQLTNPFLIAGFRPFPSTVTECLYSIFTLHNETFNIWSHLLGSLFMFRLTYLHLVDPTLAGTRRRFPALISLAAGFVFAISSLAHTLHSHSERVSDFCFMCDRGSIAGYIWACTWCSALGHFRGSKDYPRLIRRLYLAFITLLGLASSGAVAGGTLGPPLTVLTFVGQNLACIAPPIMRLSLAGTRPIERDLIITELLKSTVSAALGGLLFASHWPERQYKGKFDLIGNSHGLMHVCVVLSTWFCYNGHKKWVKTIYPL